MKNHPIHGQCFETADEVLEAVKNGLRGAVTLVCSRNEAKKLENVFASGISNILASFSTSEDRVCHISIRLGFAEEYAMNNAYKAAGSDFLNQLSCDSARHDAERNSAFDAWYTHAYSLLVKAN